MSKGYSHQLSVNLTPGSSTFKLKWESVVVGEYSILLQPEGPRR